MTHPDDLLADHVDGTLSDRERAVVDAHLETCARCRDEVELARRAVRALGDLEDVPVPTGVTGRVISEARANLPTTSRKDPSRWLAGLAAAAVIVGVIAVALTRGGGSDADLATGAEGASGAAASSSLEKGDVPLEEQRDVNYDGEAGVVVLAQEVIAEYRRTAAAPAADSSEGGEAAPSSTLAPAETLVTGAQTSAERKLADAGPAIRCFEQEGVPPAGADMVLRRLVDARYLGAPAYIAVFLQGPGAGQPPDRAVVWVLSRKDCHIEYFQNVGFDSPQAGGSP